MITNLKLRNFRNHKQLNLKFNKKFVYITGPNGSGKTSILESIYLVSTTKSHRSNKEDVLIKENEPFLNVNLQTNKNNFNLTISKEGKVTSIDKKEINKLSNFIGKLQVVMFAPEDLNIIKGSPSIRRNFIDLELMKLKPNYLTNLNKYKHILKQRNALLKKIDIKDNTFFLDVLGDQLYSLGIKLINDRRIFIDKLSLEISKVFKLFSKEDINLNYQPSVSEEDLKKHLKNNQKQDIIYKTTTQGPHRDDFNVVFKGYDAKEYASQGQMRLITIALKLALLKIIKKASDKEVILLLDDVLSELDFNVQKRFLTNLPKDIQIIMNSAKQIENKNMQIIELKERKK